MRIAVIDCGTNTFNLLVVDANRQGWTTVFENKVPVKLGAGGFDNKTIVPSRFIRGLDALYCHNQNLLNYECRDVYAVATSGIREASNGKEFVDLAKKLTGIDIKVIDGSTEAELIYNGIIQTIALGEERCLLMDIGGGSTEFIIADQSGILWKKSYLLGVSRLFEELGCSGKMTHDEIANLRNKLTESLTDLQQEIRNYNCRWLIGSSGSFDTILSLYRQAKGMMDAPDLPTNDIDIAAIPTLHHKLMNSTLEERILNPAIPSIRAQFMPLASYLVKFVLEMHSFERLIHSSHSLKEGMMNQVVAGLNWDKIEKEAAKHPVVTRDEGPDI